MPGYNWGQSIIGSPHATVHMALILHWQHVQSWVRFGNIRGIGVNLV